MKPQKDKQKMKDPEKISRNKIARIAGLTYLLTVIIPLLSMLFIDSRITVNGDVVATVNNIVANELLFRINTTIDLLMFIGVVVLSVALFEILRYVNKPLAHLALLLRLSEAVIGMLAVLSSFIALSFASGENNLEKIWSRTVLCFG